MSIRLEMLQVARLAPKVLGESAELVERFLRSRQNPDGGFQNRAGESDLYYTVFGVEGLLALQAEVASEPLGAYLSSFGDGEGLDFVHLCCLVRCWASLAGIDASRAAGWLGEVKPKVIRRIQRHRAADGGFAPVPGSGVGTAYACFLGLGAYQDAREPVPGALELERCLDGLRTGDGVWANERNARLGSTNATAAAVTVLRVLGRPIPSAVGEWLLARAHPQGGFCAAAGAPIPDLLSTATALHALVGMEVSIQEIREQCLDFVDTLWTNRGGFHGHWADDELDCEYTYYGLLALGHLSI